MAASTQTSIQLDPGTAQAIEELKTVFGVKTNAAVIRKAIALSRVAAQNSNTKEHTITLQDQNGNPIKVSLAG